jgi:hypothetical protein
MSGTLRTRAPLFLVAAVFAAACSSTPTTTPTTDPTPTAPTTDADSDHGLPDGDHQGRLVTIDAVTVTFDLVRVLSGDEAVAEARADGVEVEGDSLPNDVYVDDLETRVTVPVAGDGGFQIIDCTDACVPVGTTLDALVDGSATPFGGPNAPFDFTLDGGTVVSLVEIYLP